MMTWLRPKAWLQCAALALPLTALLGSSAQATLLWYDGFSLANEGGDYSVDTKLAADDNSTAQSGGTGTFFTGPWVSTWKTNTVTSPSLDRVYQGTNTSALINPAVGGKAATPYVGDPDFAHIGRSIRALSDAFGGLGGLPQPGTYYMGFLATWGTGPTLNHRAVEMYDTNISDDGFRTLQLGYSEWTGLGTKLTLIVKDSGLSDHSAQLSENVDFTVDNGTVHHVVLKFDMKESDFDELTTDDNDVISVYLDPVGSVEPLTPSAQISVDDFLASHMTAASQFTWPGDSSQQGTSFDELRVATTFAEVANNLQPYVVQPVVPEPTSFVLLGLASLGLLGIRKK